MPSRTARPPLSVALRPERPRRRRARIALALAAAAALGATAPAAAAALPATAPTTLPAAAPATLPAATSTGRTYTFGPGSNTGARLMAAMKALRAGDTLRILPGTYGVGMVRPDLRDSKGTASRPVKIIAADPHHTPLIIGAMTLDQPDYWKISGLRIQGNIAKKDTLTMDSGTGWAIVSTEIFGASATDAFANLVVTAISPRPAPTRWTVLGNCLHDGGNAPSSARGQLHQVYVNEVGDSVGSVIARNLFLNTPYGAAVKLGNGGATDAPGVQRVQVANNTMYDDGYAVLMHGRVRGNIVRGNMIVNPTYKISDGRSTVGVYLHQLTTGASGTSPNSGQQNWFTNATYSFFDQADQRNTFSVGGDNAHRPNPVLHQGGCSSYAPAVAAATAYGRYAKTSYYTLP